jgi:uncharacterized Zn-finger protein
LPWFDIFLCNTINRFFSLLTPFLLTKARCKFHIKNEHQYSIQNMVCQFYQKRFSSVTNLEIHKRRIHLAGKRLNCEQCEKSFATKQDLSDHLRKEHGNQKFECKNYHNLFTYKRNLDRHGQVCGKHMRERKHWFIV